MLGWQWARFQGEEGKPPLRLQEGSRVRSGFLLGRRGEAPGCCCHRLSSPRALETGPKPPLQGGLRGPCDWRGTAAPLLQPRRTLLLLPLAEEGAGGVAPCLGPCAWKAPARPSVSYSVAAG